MNPFRRLNQVLLFLSKKVWRNSSAFLYCISLIALPARQWIEMQRTWSRSWYGTEQGRKMDLIGRQRKAETRRFFRGNLNFFDSLFLILNLSSVIPLFKNTPITNYWTVPLILDHSYVVGKLTSLKIADKKCQDFRGSKAFVSEIFEFVMFPTRYEWSNIRRPVQQFVIGGKWKRLGLVRPGEGVAAACKYIAAVLPQKLRLWSGPKTYYLARKPRIDSSSHAARLYCTFLRFPIHIWLSWKMAAYSEHIYVFSTAAATALLALTAALLARDWDERDRC